MKLEIELVPKTAWFTNLRSRLPKAQWDVVRKKCYAKANYRCEICGGKGTKHPVECHEKWNFGDGKITLIGLIALCPSCHECKHPGLAGIRGRGEHVIKHLMKINEITRQEAEDMLSKAFKTYHEMSKTPSWEIDFSYLKGYLEDELA